MKKIFTTILLSVFTLAIIAQTDILPPQLNAPSDGDDEQMPDVVLDWHATTGSGVINYTLEIDLDENFTSPVVFTMDTSAAKMDKLFFGDTYYWRVKASDDTGDESDWSDVFSFVVINRFLINKPDDGEVDLPPDTEIKWKKSYSGTVLSGVTHMDCLLDTTYFWQNPMQSITNKNLMGVSSIGEQNLIVGEDGTMINYNGTEWAEIEPELFNSTSAFFVDDSIGWAVGMEGVILFYNGSQWIKQASPSSNNLNDVFFADEANGWAVGDNGTILQYENLSWSVVTDTLEQNLQSLFFTDPDNGWAVGDTGMILKYENSVWSEVTNPSSKNLYSVFCNDTTDGWAVGDSGIIIRYDGTSWTEQNSPSFLDLTSVFMNDSTNGWAVGDSGIILSYENSVWIEKTSPSYSKLYSVFFTDSINGWATGENGTILLYEDSIWIEKPSPSSNNLYSVFFTDSINGWAVGENNSFLFHDESDWIEKAGDFSISDDLNDVFLVNETTGWIIGSGDFIYNFSGSLWMEYENPTSDELLSVSFVDANHGWAVGEGGTIVFYNGNEWIEQDSDTSVDLFGVSFVDSNAGWAVGEDGLIVFYNGAEWAEVQENPMEKDLFAVSFADANNGWAVGKSGKIGYFNGIEWIEVDETGTGDDLFAISMVNSSEGYAVGEEGAFVSWDGNDWILMTSKTEEYNLNAVSNSMIVGDEGYILYQNSDGFNSPVSEILTVHADSSALFLSELYFGKDYYYRIRGSHSADTSAWSSSRYFSTIAKPVNLEPEDGATDQMLDVIVSWEEISGTYEYIYELCSDPEFSYSCTGYSDSNSFKPQGIVFGETYYWHIKARHSIDTTAWSDTWSFTVLDKLTHVSPENGSYVEEFFPTLEWVEATGVNGYYVSYADNEDFIDAEIERIDGSELNTFIIPEQLVDGEMYYWQVRAFIAGDTTQWSDPWSFIMGPSGVNDLLTENNISIYPNPSQSLVYVELNATKQTTMQIEVSNLLGEVLIIEEYTAQQGVNTHSINLEKFGTGVYLIQMQSGEEVFTQRVLIDK